MRRPLERAFSGLELSTGSTSGSDMKRRTKAVLGGVSITAFLLFFFLAPVMFWYTAYSPLVSYACSTPSTGCGAAAIPIYSEYRSLGCMALGTGTTILVGGYDMPQFQWNCYAPPMPV